MYITQRFMQKHTPPRKRMFHSNQYGLFGLADLADRQKAVAWVFGDFVACRQVSWFALAAFNFCEEVDGLVFAAAKRDVFFVQKVSDPF